MKFPAVNSVELAARITAALAARGGKDASFCRETGFQADRLSKFRNGHFTRVTGRLEVLCEHLGVEWKDLVVCESTVPLDKAVATLVAAYPGKLADIKRLLAALAKLARD